MGAASCPSSRVPCADLEEFVVAEVRHIGKDPRLLKETIAAARRQSTARKPELESDLKRLERRESELLQEKQNLVNAISKNGSGSGSLLQKLGEVESDLQEVSGRVGDIRAELAVLENQTVDENDLRKALTSFDAIWNELFPAEKARVLNLLIEKVTFDATASEVEILFRPCGIRALAHENEKETA